MGNPRIPITDIIGKKFNSWTVISESKPYIPPSGKKHRKFKCICDCGTVRDVFLTGLRNGRSKSCGGKSRDKETNLFIKHGMSTRNGNHRIYNMWGNMRARCYNKNHDSYKDYGERGIVVCPEWQEFKPFYLWAINNGYSDSKYIDRINPNKSYTVENCRFLSVADSARNTRKLQKNNTTGYRGVSKVKGKYIARITVNSKSVHLGMFDDPQKAAIAYDNIAKKLNDKRPLNFS